MFKVSTQKVYILNFISESIAMAEGAGGASENHGIRIGCAIGYAVIVLALLFWSKTDKLGRFLGIVMMGMIILFFVVVIKVAMAGKIDPTK